MGDHDKPATHIRATPALLDGWCGPALLHRTRVCVAGLDGEGCPLVWPAVTRAPIKVEHLDLDLARPEVQDRVCRVLGLIPLDLESGALYRAGYGVVASAHPSQHQLRQYQLHLPALATCTTLPEALAVWWAHSQQETP